jgi:acetyl esterase/lipase
MVLLALCVSFLLASCAQEVSSSVSSSTSLLPPSSSLPSRIIEQDARYGFEPRQDVEYAYLNDASTKPLVLFIHGGSWITGDKSMMRGYRDELVERGFIYASMNYRLILNQATFEMMLDDIHLAIDYFKTNALQMNLQTDAMAIVGVSAGGHLALLYAYSRTSPIPIELAVGLVPPVDFTDPGFLTLELASLFLTQLNFLTNSQSTQADIEAGIYPPEWLEYSPIFYAQTAVPTLLAYAGQDTLIPASNVPRLVDALSQFSIDVETIFFANSDHDLENDPDAALLLSQTFLDLLTTL